jgi:phage terminase large subunit-like protein
MALAAEGFTAEFDVECWAKSIMCRQNGGAITPINAKASTQDGLNPHLTVLDELHAHKDRALYDVLRSARGARRNPLQLVITTAGYNLEGVCYEQRKFAITVIKGLVVADHVFAAIYTIDDNDDELDPKVWPKANPNLDVSVFRRDLVAYAATARASPDSLQEFKTKRCNVWSGSRAPWLNLLKWKRCAGKFSPEDLNGAECWGGVDLASTADIAAFALVFPSKDRVRLWCRLYVPEEAVKPRSERGNVPYQRWVNDGWLITTPGDITDYDYIERDIRGALDRFDVQAISFDPWNAYHLVNKLTEDGAPMVEFRQGPKSYAPAMIEFERAVKGGALEHDGNPVLAWMASNLVVRRDVNENLAPDRKNSEDKIDGLVATIMAFGGLATFEDGAISLSPDYSMV